MATTIERLEDVGFKLEKNRRSLIMRFISHGKALTDRQLLDYASITRELLDDLDAESRSLPDLDESERKARTLAWLAASRVMCPPQGAHGNVAFKYTTDDLATRWLGGSVSVAPAATYRTIENLGARDDQEGFGVFCAHHRNRHAYFEIGGGFNCLVLCLTRTPPSQDRQFMHDRFGPKVVRIRDVKSVLAILAEHLGATDFAVKDVLYSDLKAFRKRTTLAADIPQLLGNGNLTDDKLRQLYDRHSTELLQLAEAPSVFCKPATGFSQEHERRGVIRMPSDVEQRQIIQDGRIKDLVELVI